MFYRDVKIPNTTRGTINTFLGYNHNHRISEGEFYEMQNLCSSEYPSLSPRKPRNCILSLENSDWREVDTGFEVKLEGQVSEVLGIWTSRLIEAQEKDRIRVSFAITEILSKAEIRLSYYAREEMLYEHVLTVTDSFEKIFDMPKGITNYVIQIIGTPIDMESYTEELLENSLKNLSVQFYNWNIRGMLLKDEKIAYMVGSKLYYNGEVFDFDKFLPVTDDYRERVQLLSFGVYILVFPLGLYLNTHTFEYGTLGTEYIAGNYEDTVTFTICDASGEEVTVSKEKPEEPENGTYWLDTSEDTAALYKWSESMDMWVGISSTYIRIGMHFTETPEIPFPQMFEVGDAVFMDSDIEDINKGSVIVKLGNTKDGEGNITGGYIVVKGLLDTHIEKAVDSVNSMFFRRKIPKLDYVCVSNNRVWGCYSGQIEESDIVNEIYACKLGDPKNWYSYEGTSTDSYTLSLGDDGEFTGAFTYQGYPMFFKENVIYKIYGTYPATYQLYTYNCRGVQKGSERSIAVVNEYLMYKSVQDVCVFDGSTPTGVSQCFGNVKYFEAAAGASIGKYYLSMKDENEEPVLFVFDMEKGIWHKEDALYLEEFAYNQNGELYGRNRVSMYGFANAKSVFGQTKESSEDVVHWYCETGDMGVDYPEKNYINAIQIRMHAEEKTEIDLNIKLEGQPWKKIKTIKGNDQMQVLRIPIVKERTNAFRIALDGIGPCRIDSLIVEVEKGSDR